MGVHRVVLLTLGWEELPQSISIEGADPSVMLREPVPGVLLLTDDGWLLLDTGFNTALIRDPWLARRFFNDPGYTPILPGPGEPVEEALEAAGIPLEEIGAVGVSHLHVDHAGGLKLFAGRVPVHAQRRELEFGLGGHFRTPATRATPVDHHEPERHAIFRIDFDDPAIDWRLADGEVRLAPGVTAVPTYGHTPGHQSFVVEMDDSVGGGGFVFAFDAGDLTANFEQELPIGGRVHATAEETLEPIRRLKSIAAQKGYRLVPGHDPQVWPALTEELAVRYPG